MGKKINFQPILSLQANSTLGGNDKLVVVVDTRGAISLNGKTALFAISDISQSKATYLDFENFNVVEIDQTTNKYFIKGKVYLTLEKDVLTKMLIAEIKYDVTKLKANYPNEGLLVSDLNKRIKNDWNDSFNSALKLSFQPQNPTVETAKKTVGESNSFFKKINITTLKKNKTKTAIFVFMGILVTLNLSYLFSKANNQQQNSAVSLLSAEAMAQQQEELLDKAFSDIGIDRSKLASDISCFTE